MNQDQQPTDPQQYITIETLQDFGIEVDQSTAATLLAHLNDTIEERIGAEIIESLDDEQLKELLALQETGTEDQVGEWIATHVPEYEQIVQDNIDITVGELAEGAEAINDAA